MSTQQQLRRSPVTAWPAWVTAGHKVRGGESSTVERVALPGVMTNDEQAQRLLAFGSDVSGAFIDVLAGYPLESPQDENAPVTITTQRLPLPAGSRVTDVQTSPSLGRHYVLDAASSRILIADSVLMGSFGTIRELPLILPGSVSLSSDSRIAVQSSLRDQPEVLDAALFVSAPQSSVVLEVNPNDGTCTVIAGMPGSRGVPAPGGKAMRAKLGAPSGLAFDVDSDRLLIGDRENGEIYGLSRDGGTLALVATSQPDRRLPDVLYSGDIRSPIAVMVYRLESFHIDRDRFERRTVTGRWGDTPALLLVLNGDARFVVFRLNVEGGGHVLTQLVQRAERMVALPTGELLFPTPNELFHLRHPKVVRRASSQSTLSPGS